MFHIILLQPEIPPNAGNVMRLCANTGFHLHLVQPLGFELDDRRLRRAGLDYRDLASLRVHATLEDFLGEYPAARLLAFSTRHRNLYSEFRYQAGDAMLFGPETRGLAADLLATIPAARRLTIPLRPDNRSLNLSNAVAIVAYEAWRQHGFPGADRR